MSADAPAGHVRGRPPRADRMEVTAVRVPRALLEEYADHAEALSVSPRQLMRDAMTLYARVLSRRRSDALARQVSDATERGVSFRRRRR